MTIESWDEESHSGAGYWRGLITGLLFGAAAALLLSAKKNDEQSAGLADSASRLKDKATGLGGSLGALSEQVQSLKERVTELRADNEDEFFKDDLLQSHFVDGDALALTVEDAEEIATEVRDEIGDETELNDETQLNGDVEPLNEIGSTAPTSVDTNVTKMDAVEAIPDESKEEA